MRFCHKGVVSEMNVVTTKGRGWQKRCWELARVGESFEVLSLEHKHVLSCRSFARRTTANLNIFRAKSRCGFRTRKEQTKRPRPNKALRGTGNEEIQRGMCTPPGGVIELRKLFVRTFPPEVPPNRSHEDSRQNELPPNRHVVEQLDPGAVARPIDRIYACERQ